eukprot:gene32997-44146_t
MRNTVEGGDPSRAYCTIPPMSRTSLSTSDSPSPCPSRLVLTNGSNRCSAISSGAPGPLSITHSSIGNEYLFHGFALQGDALRAANAASPCGASVPRSACAKAMAASSSSAGSGDNLGQRGKSQDDRACLWIGRRQAGGARKVSRHHPRDEGLLAEIGPIEAALLGPREVLRGGNGVRVVHRRLAGQIQTVGRCPLAGFEHDVLGRFQAGGRSRGARGGAGGQQGKRSEDGQGEAQFH